MSKSTEKRIALQSKGDRMSDEALKIEWEYLILHLFNHNDINDASELKADHLRAREAEKNLQTQNAKIITEIMKRMRAENAELKNEKAFLDRTYLIEEDKNLTVDAQLLKAKLMIKKLEAENADLKEQSEKKNDRTNE